MKVFVGDFQFLHDLINWRVSRVDLKRLKITSRFKNYYFTT